jgi:hypothetical protein
VRGVRAGAGPQRPRPADQPVAIEPADEKIVGDIEVARAGELGPHAEADVFETAVLHCQTHGPCQLLLAGQNGDVGISERQSFDDVMARPHHVQQRVVAVAVEHHFAVTGGRDGNGTIGRCRRA